MKVGACIRNAGAGESLIRSAMTCSRALTL
jgi:hypothetical protein